MGLGGWQWGQGPIPLMLVPACLPRAAGLSAARWKGRLTPRRSQPQRLCRLRRSCVEGRPARRRMFTPSACCCGRCARGAGHGATWMAPGSCKLWASRAGRHRRKDFPRPCPTPSTSVDGMPWSGGKGGPLAGASCLEPEDLVRSVACRQGALRSSHAGKCGGMALPCRAFSPHPPLHFSPPPGRT